MCGEESGVQVRSECCAGLSLVTLYWLIMRLPVYFRGPSCLSSSAAISMTDIFLPGRKSKVGECTLRTCLILS